MDKDLFDDEMNEIRNQVTSFLRDYAKGEATQKDFEWLVDYFRDAVGRIMLQTPHPRRKK